MSDALRPIGTEFEHVTSPNPYQHPSRWIITTYRIVAHSEVMLYAQRVIAEEVEIVSIHSVLAIPMRNDVLRVDTFKPADEVIQRIKPE